LSIFDASAGEIESGQIESPLAKFVPAHKTFTELEASLEGFQRSTQTIIVG